MVMSRHTHPSFTPGPADGDNLWRPEGHLASVLGVITESEEVQA